MQDIGSKTKSSLIWNTSLQIIYQVFKFGISIAIARILDPKDFGIMGIGTMIVFYMNSITNFGFNRALIHRKEMNKEHIDTVFTIDLALSSLLMAVVIIYAGPISVFFGTPELTVVLPVLSCVFLLTTFYQMPVTIYKRQLDFKIVALTDLYRGIIQSLLTLLLALMGFKYWALIAGLITSHLFGLVYIMFKSEWRPKVRYRHDAMKDIFHFGLWNFIRAQLFHINEYADKFIIGKFLGPVFLGFYEKAFSTVALQKNSLTVNIDSVMFASFSRIQEESKEKIRNYIKKSIAVTSLITFPLNTGFIMLSSYFVLILLGDKWAPAIVPMQILAAAFMFSSLNGAIASLNIGTGIYAKQAIREGVCNFLLVVICLIAVHRGIEFVALGVLFIYSLMFVLTFQLSVKHIDIRWTEMLRYVFPSLTGSVCMAAVILVFKKTIFNEINLTNFLCLFFLGSIVYILTVFVPKYAVLEEFRGTVAGYIRDGYNLLVVYFIKKKEKI